MKKLLLLSSTLFIFGLKSVSQTVVTTPAGVTYTTVIDTLEYFLNKQQYKSGVGLQDNIPYYKAPTANTATQYNHLTHCGSLFLNSDSITVLGIGGWASFGSSFNTSIPIHIYLCNVNANGLPVMPPIDTVKTVLGNNQLIPSFLYGELPHGPKKLNSNFAILMRNYSNYNGDTALFYRTSALTPTANVSWDKYGEGLGIVSRGNNAIFSKSTDFYIPKFFGGIGTDYEFCVTPVVKIDLLASQESPSDDPNPLCTSTPYTFTNTSSPSFTNRQFNQYEFYRKWQPFLKVPEPYGFEQDSVATWNFGDDLRLDTIPYHWGRVPSTYLYPNTNIAEKWFDTAGFPDKFCGTFQITYKKMCAQTHGYRTIGTVTLCTMVYYCYGDGFGIKENALTNVKIAPNPATDGKTTISGLEGKNTIIIYNMLGQMVSSDVTDKEIYVVDLLKQPAGTYLLRVVDSAQRSKNIRIINEKN